MTSADVRTTPMTAHELALLSPEQPCELVRGELRMMSPSKGPHGVVAGKVFGLLYPHVASGRLGEMFAAETGFLIERDPDTVRAPDVAFVRQARIDVIGVPDAYFPEAPTLAVEVVSPNDQAERVHEKARMWIEAGCEAVWLVWPEDRSVTDYRSLDNIRVLKESETLTGGDAVPGFSVRVGDLFVGLS